MDEVLGTHKGQEPAELSAADEQVLRELTERARGGGLKLTAEGGLLGRLTKMVMEGALEGELDDHLGYGKHNPAGRDGGNSRNGHRAKTVITDTGPVEIAVPRDRESSFDPKIVAKRQRRLTGVDDMVTAFGFAGTGADDPGRPAFPKVRVVTVSECAWHVVADAAMGAVAGKGAGEQSLARKLYRRLGDDWLLIADRNFFNWADWCTAADTGAQLLWRVKSGLTLPVLALLPDGSYSSVLVNPEVRGKAREALLEAARGGQDLGEDQGRYVRVVEYEVPDRDGDGKGEVIALVTTITGMTAAPGPLLAEACHQRWEHETGNAQLKTYLRGPGKVLRSKSPDMVRQEIYGYLLTHYALSALICRAATEAGIDPDRVKFKRTVRIVRRRAADPAAFPP